MPTIAPQLSAAANRPLNVRVRSDLTYVRQTYQGRNYWVVKDPIGLKYYRFEDEEFALMQMLDGQTTPQEIKERFEQQFPPQQITLSELAQLIGMLHRSSLLVSDATGQGIQLKTRGDRNRRKMRWAMFANLLSFRFRGVDPDRFLGWLNRYMGWFFTRPALIAAILMMLSALAMIATHFDVFQNKLPGFHEFFAAKNWVWLALTLAVTKILHEFGHGVSCKRFGGQCHELGVMLLVLTPCLYCNVSDSWTLPSKWKRAAIAAAGMYVELVLASIATFVWWFSEPGIVNHLALNVMFVCSVSTVLFNGNPLLRYDGYYILADLIEIPNLRQKATTLFQRTLNHWCLGIAPQPDPFLPSRHRWLFVLYSIAAALYRWVILLSIFWFLYNLLEPYGLQLLGQLIALAAVYSLVVHPIVQVVRYFAVPGRLAMVKRWRVSVTGAVVGVLLLVVLFVPLPYYVNCSFYVQPRDSAAVYVTVPGVTEEIFVQPNEHVETGQKILQLRSSELDQMIARQTTELAISQARYIAAERMAHEPGSTINNIETTKKAFDAAERQLAQRTNERRRLEIVAPVAGTVLAAPYVARPDDTDSGRLIAWYGHPLERRNRGAYLEAGTLVCQIVPDVSKLEAVLAIDQADIEFIRPDEPVVLWIRQLPGREFRSRVGRISPVKMTSVPKGLSSQYGGDLVTTANPDGSDQPQSTTYQVSVVLNEVDARALAGATGWARVRAGHLTIGQRLWRTLWRTFRFEL